MAEQVEYSYPEQLKRPDTRPGLPTEPHFNRQLYEPSHRCGAHNGGKTIGQKLQRNKRARPKHDEAAPEDYDPFAFHEPEGCQI